MTETALFRDHPILRFIVRGYGIMVTELPFLSKLLRMIVLGYEIKVTANARFQKPFEICQYVRAIGFEIKAVKLPFVLKTICNTE